MDTGAIGQRFSLNYLTRGSPSSDSPRFRRRLLALFNRCTGDDTSQYSALIEHETGARVPMGGYGSNWEKFFITAELRDALDSITLIYQVLNARGLTSRTAWLQEVERIFAEENLGYRLDKKSGVHLGVDAEFEHNRASTMRSLGGERYRAALVHFEGSHNALDQVPPDTRASIRAMFDTAETLFKLLLDGKVSRLGSSEITKNLSSVIRRIYVGNALDTALLLAKSFGEWTNAAHQYRHVRGVEEPEPPPLDIAVLFVSAGASYVRWLAELDQSKGGSGGQAAAK